MYRPNLKSVALLVPEIIAISFDGGCEAPMLGVGDGNHGTIRKSDGEFL